MNLIRFDKPKYNVVIDIVLDRTWVWLSGSFR